VPRGLLHALVPALYIGLLSNLAIMKLDVCHDLAQQMEPPEIIRI
jgi:hypothetical protein